MLQVAPGYSTAHPHSMPMQTLLATETIWREVPSCAGAPRPENIVVGHWTDARNEVRELGAPVLDQHYVISVLLDNAAVDCHKDGRLLAKGVGGVGGAQLTEPGEQVRCTFRGPNEALHLFFPQAMVASVYQRVRCRGPAFHLEDPAFHVDPVLGQLARMLASTEDTDGHFNALCGEGLAYAMLAHVLSRYARETTISVTDNGLPLWRLRRAIDYIDANLADPITLQDIAQHTGLSRMHFAMQFRITTGRTPHAFLLSQRVERAKSLLQEGMPIVQAALAVGFQAQAHFTTAFRKMNGITPGRWRAQQRAAIGGGRTAAIPSTE